MYFNLVYSTILFLTPPMSALLARPYLLFILFYLQCTESNLCFSFTHGLENIPRVWLTYLRSHILKENVFLPISTPTHHPSTFQPLRWEQEILSPCYVHNDQLDFVHVLYGQPQRLLVHEYSSLPISIRNYLVLVFPQPLAHTNLSLPVPLAQVSELWGQRM